MDIVDKLKNKGNFLNPDGPEGAKEIERLREALQKIIDYDWRWEGGGKLGKIEGFCAKIARSALQQKESE